VLVNTALRSCSFNCGITGEGQIFQLDLGYAF